MNRRIATRMKPLNPTEGNPIRSRHWLQPVAIAVIALGQVACAQTPTQAVAAPERPAAAATQAAPAVQLAPNTVSAPAAVPAPAAAAPAQPASAIPPGQLPAEVTAALQRGKLPLDAVSVVVMDASGTQRLE